MKTNYYIWPAGAPSPIPQGTITIEDPKPPPANPELDAAKALAMKLSAGTATAADKDGVLKYMAKAQGLL
jgi:hypothetical protein